MRRRRVQSHDVSTSSGATTTEAAIMENEIESLLMRSSSEKEISLGEMPTIPIPKPHRFNELHGSISTGSVTPSPPLSPSSNQAHNDNNSRRSTSLRRTSASSTIKPLDDFSLRYHVNVIFKQSLALAQMLIHGTPRWIIKPIRLMAFVLALIPAFVVTVWYYFVTSDRISVSYIPSSSSKTNQQGKVTVERTSRHYLDIYGTSIPSPASAAAAQGEGNKPVLIFLTGGAWIIGYKAWGTLLARVLSEFGVLVVIPDYRNFPQTSVQGMISDVDAAIEFVLENAATYGGDPAKVVICGQSAGAHLGACILLEKSQFEKNKSKPNPKSSSTTTTTSSTPQASGTSRTTSWHAYDIQGFIAVSGPYDLVSMRGILHQHGLDKSIVNAMFGHDLKRYSPTLIVQALLQQSAEERQLRCVQKYFPKTSIIHGQSDKTVPYQISIEFYNVLQQLLLPNNNNHQNNGNSSSDHHDHQATAAATTTTTEDPALFLQFKLYPTWSHTDPILEAPFAGNHLFHKDVYDLIQLWTSTSSTCSTTTTTKETTTTTTTTTNTDTDTDTGNTNDKEEEQQQQQQQQREVAVEEEVSCLLSPFDEDHPACRKICPLTLVQIARFCNPF